MGRLDFLYRTELPHRAKLVYIYLHDRMDKEKRHGRGLIPSQGSVTIPQHRQAGNPGFRKSRTDTKRAALPGQRKCDLKSVLSALKNINDLQGRSLPKRWTEGRFIMGRLEPPTLRRITAEKKNISGNYIRIRTERNSSRSDISFN